MSTPSDQQSAFEPVVVVESLSTAYDREVINGDLSRGLPAWIYDDYVRITPRAARTAVLYTATGAHDLTDVIAAMSTCDASLTIRTAIDDATGAPVDRFDLDRYRRQAYEHAQATWTTYLDGLDLP